MARFRCLVVEDSRTVRQPDVSAPRRLPELEVVRALPGVERGGPA